LYTPAFAPYESHRGEREGRVRERRRGEGRESKGEEEGRRRGG